MKNNSVVKLGFPNPTFLHELRKSVFPSRPAQTRARSTPRAPPFFLRDNCGVLWCLVGTHRHFNPTPPSSLAVLPCGSPHEGTASTRPPCRSHRHREKTRIRRVVWARICSTRFSSVCAVRRRLRSLQRHRSPRDAPGASALQRHAVVDLYAGGTVCHDLYCVLRSTSFRGSPFFCSKVSLEEEPSYVGLETALVCSVAPEIIARLLVPRKRF